MDFEKFCYQFGEISDKSSGEKINLKLNGAQRCVYEYLEHCRSNKIPCRLLILKSRQLGISTLLQYYFSWLLIFHCELETFLSLCHNKQLSKAFINNMVNIYARYNQDGKPHKIDENVLEDKKGNHLIFSSAKNYNSTRGFNIGIAHMSESAFWHSKTSDWSEEVIRSVMGSVGNRPGTFVVMESTSDGRNNYFYRLWRDSLAGITSYHTIFLGWNLCEYYSKPLNSQNPMNDLSARENKLKAKGFTLEQLLWYREKRKEFQDEASFLREFPCSADESFLMSSNDVFSNQEIEKYKSMVKNGKLIDFTTEYSGKLECFTGTSYNQWEDVDYNNHYRYFVVVTIGSSISESKHNVLTVWSWHGDDVIELCLERRFICDLDELINESKMIAVYYKNAMLIVEVNNLNRLGMSSKEYYIRKLMKLYPRLYQQDGKIGYAMSHKQKLRGLFSFQRRLRENKILDYSKLMLDEMENFVLEDEEITASFDSHDDVLLCRLILCDVLDILGPLRPALNPKKFYKNNATFFF